MLSRNLQETAKIAKIFLDRLLENHKNRDSKHQKAGALVVALSGELGSGKTAFTKSVAKHLHIKAKVHSPTFIIMRKYPIQTKEHKFFFHLDAYRLSREEELTNLGWQDVINNPEHLVFIEWPENMRKALPNRTRFVYIKHQGKNNRYFKFNF